MKRSTWESIINASEKAMKALLQARGFSKTRLIHYGAVDIHPNNLAIWVIVQTDEVKNRMISDPDLLATCGEILAGQGYPGSSMEFIHIGVESEETINRESAGNWYLHFK